MLSKQKAQERWLHISTEGSRSKFLQRLTRGKWGMEATLIVDKVFYNKEGDRSFGPGTRLVGLRPVRMKPPETTDSL